MELKDFAFVIFRYKYWVVAFVGASLAAAVVGLRLKTPTYEASAELLVKLGREISAPSQDIPEAQGYVMQKRRQDIYAEVEILRSTYLVEQVAREIGPERILSSGEESEARGGGEAGSAVRELVAGMERLVLGPASAREATLLQRATLSIQGKLDVEAIIKSDMIRIAYVDDDIDRAEKILKTFLSKYFQRHIEVHKSPAMEDVFQPKAEYYRGKLAEIDEALAALKKENDIYEIELERAKLIEEQSHLRAELEEAEREIIRKRDKVERLEDQISSEARIVELPEAEDRDPVIDTLKNRLVELELEREQLLHDYSAESRKVNDVGSEIRTVRDQLAREEGRILETNRKDVEVLKRKAESLRQQIEAYRAELEEINDVEAEKNRLERDQEISERNYFRYAQELEEGRISAAMDLARITNVRVLQPVSVSPRPEGPRKSLVLLLTAAVSSLLGVALVFLLDFLDHSIRTARDVERLLGLPVLGSIREDGEV